jgi:hypothetical protein
MDCISIIKKASESAGMNFQLGHLEEICNILASNTNANLTTYPCVMVLEDIREVEEEYKILSTLQVLIVVHSDLTIRPLTRWDDVMQGQLLELYNNLIAEIEKEAQVVKPINKIYRPLVSNAFNFGASQTPIFNDHLNGIELRDFKFSFINNC